MKTELDIHNYQRWFLENFQYRDRLLTLTVEEMLTKEEQLREPQRYLVIFSFTVMFQVYDECDHRNDFHADRQEGVLAKYNASRLLEHAKSDTIVFDTTVGALEHWSLMTTNEFVHVLTNQPPKVINVT
ncbi:hypothetical protein [Pseudoalteromonas rubra]|uniref:hypothetical protein n=1 Tax=Pseudoalteromonas rubra TaxID=43658 RepID=UPI000F778D64|nr:hypothetical protein [Pseudoalteromonas rubra]